MQEIEKLLWQKKKQHIFACFLTQVLSNEKSQHLTNELPNSIYIWIVHSGLVCLSRLNVLSVYQQDFSQLQLSANTKSDSRFLSNFDE